MDVADIVAMASPSGLGVGAGVLSRTYLLLRSGVVRSVGVDSSRTDVRYELGSARTVDGRTRAAGSGARWRSVRWCPAAVQCAGAKGSPPARRARSSPARSR